MPAKVVLTITAGPEVGHSWVFAERTTALIGRDPECHIRFPKDQSHQTVSRHHCLLDINPPDVCIRDLGSRGGTHVNGELIGRRDKAHSAAEAADVQFAEFPLKHGDQIKVGPIVLQVEVTRPLLCRDCGAEIAAEQQEPGRPANGDCRCESCQARTPLPETVDYQPGPPTCPSCGGAVAATNEAGEPGASLCSRCRAQPEQLARRMLDLASTGRQELQPIRGFRLEKVLGRGGMGAVFLAVNARTGQRVALKVMLPAIATTKRNRDLFLREAVNMKALNHLNVVRLFELGCSEGTFYFTQEYCVGGSVARLLKKQQRTMPIAKAVPLIVHALKGLAYAHEVEFPSVLLADGSFVPARGLVHRDIKPQNIFLAKSGKGYIPKIGDYGLAKAFDLAGLSGLSVTGEATGTPFFMARQQFLDFRNARPEVDVWAMAASLYYMLSLCYPRDFPKGKDPWQVVLQSDAVPIRERAPSIPAKLAEVIDAALVDRPEIHFKTAAALRQALEASA
jgi:serine/threonine-protein kinase